MKNIIIIILALSITVFGCKKSSDEIPEIPPGGFQWPAGTGEYAPYTTNSTFTFEIASGTPTVIDSFTYTVIKDTSINNLNFKKLQSNKPALAPTYFSNYNAGVVTNITYNLNFQNLVTIPVVTETVLKESVAVNGTWNETINVPVPMLGTIPVANTFTVTQKDFVKNILGKDYAGTIAIKQLITLPAGLPLPPGIPSSSQIDNYFAKGVGIVQKDATGNVVKIKRFNVVK